MKGEKLPKSSCPGLLVRWASQILGRLSCLLVSAVLGAWCSHACVVFRRPLLRSPRSAAVGRLPHKNKVTGSTPVTGTFLLLLLWLSRSPLKPLSPERNPSFSVATAPPWRRTSARPRLGLCSGERGVFSGEGVFQSKRRKKVPVTGSEPVTFFL